MYNIIIIKLRIFNPQWNAAYVYTLMLKYIDNWSCYKADISPNLNMFIPENAFVFNTSIPLLYLAQDKHFTALKKECNIGKSSIILVAVVSV